MSAGKRAAGAALVAFLVVAAGGAYWWQRRTTSRGEQEPAGAAAEQPPAALPDVSLQVNAADSVNIRPGFPLLLRVRLANPRAINAALRQRLDDREASAVREQMSRGAIARENAEKRLAALTGKPRPGALALPAGAEWERLVSFRLAERDGKQQPFETSLIPSVQPQPRALNAEQTVELEYGVAPEETAPLTPGEYRLVAVLDAPAPEAWQGRVESLPVKVVVAEASSSHLDPTEEERLHLGAARYYHAVRNLTKALEHVQKALAARPHSVPANIVFGELKEDSGDLAGALEAYQGALKEYEGQHPKALEPHQYLTMKTSALLHKLAEK